MALPIKEACPNPTALTLSANTPNVFTADFNAGMLALPRAFPHDPSSNERFLYTLQWRKEQRCCEMTRAVLTVKMKANRDGTSYASNDAGNDGIAIAHSGNAVLPFSEVVYTPPNAPPSSAGQTANKTWALHGAASNNLKANHRLTLEGIARTCLSSYNCAILSPTHLTSRIRAIFRRRKSQ